VVTGRDQQQRGGVRADAVQREQAGGAARNERADELIEPLELGIEELGAPTQLPQRDAGGVAGHVAGAGPQRRQVADRAVTVCLANRARRSSGPVTMRDRAWLMAWVRSLRALRLATISARIARLAMSRYIRYIRLVRFSFLILICRFATLDA